ncbi:replication protein RepA [Undibacterium sp. SXout11W]|uniref:replication protein RepA n=1 Tax=Undibacterium sp. SXout11W TaxID=3413050 RepID=UPI003BF227DD
MRDGIPQKKQRHLISDASEIDQTDTEAEKVFSFAHGYLPSALVQATLPHKKPDLPPGAFYQRQNGKFTLTISPTSPRFGIPYGTVPRLLLAWISTEVLNTRQRVLSLGECQAKFLEKLSLNNDGRDIPRFREQSLRLFNSVISIENSDLRHGEQSRRLLVSDQSFVLWQPQQADANAIWTGEVELSQNFFDEILTTPVPFNLNIYRSLRSPLAMDVYCWLSYRIFLLNRSGKPFVFIPWRGLQMQFGSGYADIYSFKTNFIKQLRVVLNYYEEAREAVEDDKQKRCLKLYPCALHIPQKPKTNKKVELIVRRGSFL